MVGIYVALPFSPVGPGVLISTNELYLNTVSGMRDDGKLGTCIVGRWCIYAARMGGKAGGLIRRELNLHKHYFSVFLWGIGRVSCIRFLNLEKLFRMGWQNASIDVRYSKITWTPGTAYYFLSKCDLPDPI